MNAPEQPTQAETKPVLVNARRKLIRGAFALPAVAAVHSASALAVSSSLRCLTNGVAGNHPRDVPKVLYTGQSESPSYLRIPLAVTKKVTNSSSSNPQYRYYVAFADLNAAAGPMGVTFSLVGDNRFREFNEVANKFKDSGTGEPQNAIEDNNWTLQAWSTLDPINQKTAVLIFSTDGKQIVGVGEVSGAGHVASTSCWNSFGV